MRAGRMLALRRAPQLVLAVALMLATVWFVPARANAETRAEPQFVAAVQTTMMAPGTDVPVTAEISNPDKNDLVSGSITVALSATTLGSAGAVTDWISAGGASTPTLARTSTLPVPASGTTASTVTIPAANFTSTGVWGIQATFTVAATQYVSRTVVVVTEGMAPVEVSTVVAITAPHQPDGLLSSSTLADLTSPTGELTRQLDAITGTTVTVGIDPRILASIRALGSNAPASATAWLARLQAANFDSFALQYGDADPAIQGQLGAPTLLSPGDYSDLGLTAADLAGLTTFNFTRGMVWPAPSTLIGNDVKVMQNTGYQHFIVSSNNVSEGAGAAAHIDQSTAYVAQEQVSSALSAAISANSAAGWQAGMNQLQATLTFFGGQHLVITSNRAVAANTARAQATLAYLTGSAQSHMTPLATVDIANAAPASIIDRLESPERLSTGRHIVDRNASVAAFSVVAVTPTDLSNPSARETLVVLGVGWMGDPAAWTPAVAAFDLASAAVLNGVSVVSSSTINVLASEASLPFTIDNALNTPINVRVTVAPSNGRIVVGSAVDAEIAAKSRQTVRVPVKARIGSGNVALAVSLSASNGMPVGTPTVIQANVQADWEGWGAAIIALLAAGLFGFGIVRQVRRVRRNRALTEAGESRE